MINELSDKLKLALSRAVNPKFLRLIILPTEKCNFRCTYCYETYDHGTIKKEVVMGIKKLIEHRVTDLSYLQLEWFGGEPLLAWKKIIDISQHAQQQCMLHNCEFLPGGMTTNGYLLTPDLLEQFMEINLTSFQISFDGNKEAHDKTRVSVSGRGTFDTIYNNLLALAKTDHAFGITLRLHLTPDNHKNLLTLCTCLGSGLLQDERFSVFIKPIGDWGGKNTGNISTLEKDIARTRVNELVDLLSSMGVTRVSMHIEGEVFDNLCYASEPNALVIRSTGGLAKCTVAFNDPVNDVGHLNEDGTLTLKHDRLNLWFTGLKTKEAETLSCPYYTIKKTASAQANLIKEVKVFPLVELANNP